MQGVTRQTMSLVTRSTKDKRTATVSKRKAIRNAFLRIIMSVGVNSSTEDAVGGVLILMADRYAYDNE